MFRVVHAHSGRKFAHETRSNYSMSSLKTEKKILCIGLMCIDLVVTSSEYPKEDSNCAGLDQRWQCGGNPANNCEVLTYLAGPCELWTAIASDNEKLEDKYYIQFLVDDLTKRGVCFENCIYYKNVDCPYSFITLNISNGTRTAIHQNKNLPDLTASQFAKFNLKNYKWIHFEGRNLQEVPKMMRAIQDWNAAHRAEDRIIISLEMEFTLYDHSGLTSFADYIFVNKEIAMLAGFPTKEDAAKSYSQPAKPGATFVFPWGEEGALARCADGKIVSSPAFPPVQVIDSLGAGDTFLSSTIYALSEGHDIAAAIDFGCQLAGAKCGARGLAGAQPFARRIYDKMFPV